ncbi:metabotropic glutamate receptor 3-like [Tubulanus polymorphus]|uniref:metabotropic glutamate receptor 3-like n=1 Tax=Tubulanus polymorphus TaxID=672921 RepID=UPI003DA2B9DD
MEIPDLDNKHFEVDGDLVLGVLSWIHYSDERNGCSEKAFLATGIAWTEMFKFVVNEINNNATILPNITLGLDIYDECMSTRIAAGRAMQLLHRAGTFQDTASNFTSQKHLVGVIGGILSSTAVAISRIFTPFELPQLSMSATSAELDSRFHFPYFLRLPPSDAAQTIVIVDLIRYFGWKYFAILYRDDSYGINAMQMIMRLTRNLPDVCIAYSKAISDDNIAEDTRTIVKQLIKDGRVRVVVTFLYSTAASGLLEAVDDITRTNYFTFIFSDSITPSALGTGRENAIGALSLGVDSGYKGDDYFFEIYEKYTYKNLSANNPWKHQYMERMFNCTWIPSKRSKCQQFVDTPFSESLIRRRSGFFTYSMAHDTIFTYAMALHKLIETKCPDLFSHFNKTLANMCITTKHMLPYLYNVSFVGKTGHIDFDKNGNGMFPYQIDQWQFTDGKFKMRTIGNYDQFTKELSISRSLVTWYNYTRKGTGGKYLVIPSKIQKSTCSDPCKPTEYVQTLESKCCWECNRCRNNEYIDANITKGNPCIACPPYMWPNPDDSRSCRKLSPQYLDVEHSIGIGLCFAAVVSMLLTCLVTGILVKYRRNRLVKACSLELSVLTLVGILSSFLVVCLLMIRPGRFVCWLQRFGFAISYTVVYTPLLVKSTRMYRIFSAGKRGISKLKYISNSSQMIVTSIVLLLQSLLAVTSALVYPPVPRFIMPVLTTPYVELICDLPVPALVIPLSFNILIIFVTAVLGFLTRALPDNFNESRYIFMSALLVIYGWNI